MSTNLIASLVLISAASSVSALGKSPSATLSPLAAIEPYYFSKS